VVKGIPRLPEGKTGDSKNRHGDAAIAIAMAYYASLMEAVEIEFTAAPGANSGWNGSADETDNEEDLVETGGAW
jgi:phage FluMu gp28-like protein